MANYAFSLWTVVLPLIAMTNKGRMEGRKMLATSIRRNKNIHLIKWESTALILAALAIYQAIHSMLCFPLANIGCRNGLPVHSRKRVDFLADKLSIVQLVWARWPTWPPLSNVPLEVKYRWMIFTSFLFSVFNTKNKEVLWLGMQLIVNQHM